MKGFISTSKSKELALEFGFSNCTPPNLPVLFKIRFKTDKGVFDMKSLNKKFSAYPKEDEVILQDGLSYQVMNVGRKTEEDVGTYFEIELQHPPEIDAKPYEQRKRVETLKKLQSGK